MTNKNNIGPSTDTCETPYLMDKMLGILSDKYFHLATIRIICHIRQCGVDAMSDCFFVASQKKTKNRYSPFIPNVHDERKI